MQGKELNKITKFQKIIAALIVVLIAIFATKVYLDEKQRQLSNCRMFVDDFIEQAERRRDEERELEQITGKEISMFDGPGLTEEERKQTDRFIKCRDLIMRIDSEKVLLELEEKLDSDDNSE